MVALQKLGKQRYHGDTLAARPARKGKRLGAPAIPVGRHLHSPPLSGTESDQRSQIQRQNFPISLQPGEKSMGDPPQNHKCNTKSVLGGANPKTRRHCQLHFSIIVAYPGAIRLLFETTRRSKPSFSCLCHLWCLPYVFIFACGCGSSFVVINKRCDS